MEDLSNNSRDSLVDKTDNKIKIEHPECKSTFRERKVSLSKKARKTYNVTVTYIQVTAEEAKMKRAIIENIIKKAASKQDGDL